MRPYGFPQQLEKRRRYALGLLKDGTSLATVARTVCASVSSVWEWQQAYRKHGAKGLCPKPTPGRPSELSRVQKKKLVQLLLRGPKVMGFDTELWTLKRIVDSKCIIIRDMFGSCSLNWDGVVRNRNAVRSNAMKR